MAQEKVVRAFVSRIVKGYRAFLRTEDVFPDDPWAHASDLADRLYYAAYSYMDSSDEAELIRRLAQVSYNDFNELKAVWDTFGESQRVRAFRQLLYAVAKIGYEELLDTIANSWELKTNADKRRQVIDAFKRYITDDHANSRMRLAVALVNIFWPDDKVRKESEDRIIALWNGLLLDKFIPWDKVEKLIEKHILSAEASAVESTAETR
jgi:hypothetical protein